ncbi:hypothetical protein O181_002086 [Austropuccinia psidii MF-1]|uniref:Uncharacterized protein n=1 Tax=Austropuccinia psidii MF-1 TaxID=1389203 RepID=A0A9Q3GD01_9BASI|nr:hypothetical protein [Austropuccinia psidii MF-1]
MSVLNHPYTYTCPPHSLRHLPCLGSCSALKISLHSLHSPILTLLHPHLKQPKYIPLTPPPHFHFHPSMPFCAPTKSPLLLECLIDLTPDLPPHPYMFTHPPNSLRHLQSLCSFSAT